jgi:DNA-binding response OmpR family regulator
MIVDDDRTMTTLLQMLLELDGYAVHVVPHGTQVVAQAKAEKPDAVIMDVHLADAYGTEVLRQIRSDAELRDLRVIMSSGMDVESQCADAGATAFILKPYQPDELSKLIQTVLS